MPTKEASRCCIAAKNDSKKGGLSSSLYISSDGVLLLMHLIPYFGVICWALIQNVPVPKFYTLHQYIINTVITSSK